ncbi:hypothetical protein CgunFtcFv8_019653 [Champsocephalus gunnari]|uniref:Uncharacterized protein n=1 Tax=Champsocephalus gunnari TaxID=52237 RepID=A0AAN8DJU7_CHAGU|nr:hypothetical protein CgunFtcFv8_019653 [Champsocephalus gunnari]
MCDWLHSLSFPQYACMEDTLLVLIAGSGLMLKPLQSGSFRCVLYRMRRRPSGEEGASAKWLGGGGVYQRCLSALREISLGGPEET